MTGLRVALLHGLAGSTALWQRWCAQPPDRVEPLPVDIDWPVDGSAHPGAPGDPAELVARAVRTTGAEVVVAHSFAANALLEYLVRERDSGLRGAVLVSPFYRPRQQDFDWAAISHYFNRFHLILEEGLRVSSGDRLPPVTRESMALRVRERIGPYGWMDFFGAYLRTPGLAVHRVRIPVLTVAGEDDFAARPADAAALDRALPDGRLEILPSCGHFPMAEQPTRFGELLTEFLGSLTAAPHRPGGPPPAITPLEMT
ncbi:alpha/beta hydrolase [Streptomyces sp. TX20-6-3]|uniref:alpha/beta fold hydrolase n=1 Tax=Streptomyces sp. TX20-6-3 TaxID=3028705 RepID=UPI0029A20065|nr:alpha/beta hydrolase [Streptomyces sp. TX20-6-3]MDX2561389.1 alpha/beta hydrolase [Streptomyces sp. TX20-6-3]